MEKKLIGMIGYFATGLSKSGGQEAKTCAIAEELDALYGSENIIKIDTLNWKKHPLRLFYKLFYLGFRCKNVVMLPAHKSVRIFSPLLILARVFSKCRIHYIVIGGWLPALVKNNLSLRKITKKIDYIYVETSSMKQSLEEQGFQNVVLFPNFKNIKPISITELNFKYLEPYKWCFFARIKREKGVADIVDAVLELNERYGRTISLLDIYGPIQKGEEEWFANLTHRFGDAIRYKGFVEPNESVATLKDYFGMLFPTHYRTEGIPGTIIDAYSAGIPVICSRWDNCGDILDEGITGYGYEMENNKELMQCLEKVIVNPENFISMKSNCIKKALNFSPDNVMRILAANIVN